MNVRTYTVLHRGYAVRLNFTEHQPFERVPFNVVAFTCRLLPDGSVMQGHVFSEVRTAGVDPESLVRRVLRPSEEFHGTLPEEVREFLQKILRDHGHDTEVWEVAV